MTSRIRMLRLLPASACLQETAESPAIFGYLKC